MALNRTNCWGEKKPEFQLRLNKSGELQGWKDYREELKTGGIHQMDAGWEAMKRFPPEGQEPLEIDWDTMMQRAVIQEKDDIKKIKSEKNRQLVINEQLRILQQGQHVPELPPPSKKKAKKKNKVVADEEVTLDLEDSEDPEGSEAPLLKGFSMWSNYQWVYENLGNNEITEEDAPSPGAWSQMEHYTANPGAKALFYKEIAMKMIPAKSQLEAEQKFTDANDHVFEFLDECADAADAAEVANG